EVAGDGLPALAREDVWKVHRADERVAIPQVDERDRALRVVLVEQLLLGRARRLQRIAIAVAGLDAAKVDVLARGGGVGEWERRRVRILDRRRRAGRLQTRESPEARQRDDQRPPLG